jgi:hypothetical protein
MTLPSIRPYYTKIDQPYHTGELKAVLKYIISLARWRVICDEIVMILTIRRGNGELSGQYEAEKGHREMLPETGTRVLMPISTRRRTDQRVELQMKRSDNGASVETRNDLSC